MSRLLALLGIILAFHCSCEAVTFEILKPVRDTGDEVGLIFTSGNEIKGEQFRKTAEAIQAASGLRVWVALTADYFLGQTTLHTTGSELDGAIKALKKAGMTSENFVGVAHGIGGKFLYSKVKDFPMKAIILLGFCLPLKTSPSDYPVPVLTLAAELDGVTRITRAAEEFGKLEAAMRTSVLMLYRAPVIYLEGMNHAQFASGEMPTRVKINDLQSDIEEDEAHTKVGESVATFLTTTFSNEPTKVDEALKQLEQAYTKAEDKFKPFLEVKSLDLHGNISQWTVMAQRHVADYAYQVIVNNKVGEKLWFLQNDASMRKVDDVVIVETKTLVHYGLKIEDSLMMVDIPREINMKLKTKEAIMLALTGDDANGTSAPGLQSTLRIAPTTCKSLNELALQVALDSSTPEARRRYTTSGRPIIFEDDSEISSDLFWGMFSSEQWEKKDGLHVRAVAFRTPVTARNPGLLYCKVMSPYHAMDWVNVQSLQNPPHL